MAIASNIAFIAYGGLADVGPVLLLHVLLLPINVFRLVQLRAHALRRATRVATLARARRNLS